MSSVCDVNKVYDLGAMNGIPDSCSPAQEDQILLKALDSPNPDQRFAAVKRANLFGCNVAFQKKAIKVFKNEKDPYVQSELVKLFTAFDVKEAVPELINKLNNSAVWHAIVPALQKLADASAVPALQNAFKNNPSKIIAAALLNLGDPHPYLDNFAMEDLKVLTEPDTAMIYTDPYWWILFGGSINIGFFVTDDPFDFTNSPGQAPGIPSTGMSVTGAKPFNTKKIPTAAAEMKPAVKKHFGSVVGLLAKTRSKKAVPFLLALALNPKNPVSPKKIYLAFKNNASPEDTPLLVAELNKEYKATSDMIIQYFADQLSRDDVDMDEKYAIIQVFRDQLKNEKNRSEAIHILSEIGDRSIIPQLLVKIEKDPYCGLEVMALSKLQEYPGEYEAIFKTVVHSGLYCEDARVNAAIALALEGHRDGIELLFQRIYDMTTGMAADSGPGKLEFLCTLVSAVMKPEDKVHLKKLLKQFHPQAVLIGLELLKRVGNEDDISLILPRLKEDNLDVERITVYFRLNGLKDPDETLLDKFKLEVRFHALLTLASIHDQSDTATLEIIKKELKYWESYLADHIAINAAAAKLASKGMPSQLQLSPEAFAHLASPQDSAFLALISEFLPSLEEHVEEAEMKLTEYKLAQPALLKSE